MRDLQLVPLEVEGQAEPGSIFAALFNHIKDTCSTAQLNDIIIEKERASSSITLNYHRFLRVDMATEDKPQIVWTMVEPLRRPHLRQMGMDEKGLDIWLAEFAVTRFR